MTLLKWKSKIVLLLTVAKQNQQKTPEKQHMLCNKASSVLGCTSHPELYGTTLCDSGVVDQRMAKVNWFTINGGTLDIDVVTGRIVCNYVQRCVMQLDSNVFKYWATHDVRGRASQWIHAERCPHIPCTQRPIYGKQ